MKKKPFFIKWGIISTFILCAMWFLYVYVTIDKSYSDDQVFYTDMKIIKAELQSYYHGKKHYPMYSIEELLKTGGISEDSFNSLNEYEVQYFPFSAETPEKQVIMKVQQGKLFGRVFEIKKEDLLMKPPYEFEAHINKIEPQKQQ